jgi:flagellar biosynthesis protein FliR
LGGAKGKVFLMETISWVLMAIGIIGFFVTFPLWFKDKLSDRHMIGLTLVLSWAALWYTAFIAIIQSGK